MEGYAETIELLGRRLIMIHIPKELVESTWRAVGALTGEQILRIQKNHRKAQRALTMFAYDNFADFRGDAAGVGIYVYHVVLEAFSRALPRPTRVAKAQIERSLDNQRQRKEFDLETSLEESPEPHVLRYVYEALSEDAEDVVLSEHEREHIFGVLEAVVLCLHDSCERK